jgi:hypothetical protein
MANEYGLNDRHGLAIEFLIPMPRRGDKPGHNQETLSGTLHLLKRCPRKTGVGKAGHRLQPTSANHEIHNVADRSGRLIGFNLTPEANRRHQCYGYFVPGAAEG